VMAMRWEGLVMRAPGLCASARLRNQGLAGSM